VRWNFVRIMLAVATSEKMYLVVNVVVCKARSKHLRCLDLTVLSFRRH
jgi:hypothetical protein